MGLPSHATDNTSIQCRVKVGFGRFREARKRPADFGGAGVMASTVGVLERFERLIQWSYCNTL